MVGEEIMILDEVECNSFFDQMDDLVEFPSDNNSGLFSGGSSDDFSAFWSDPPLPYEDIAQLEWLSTFVEDSFSGGGGLTINEKNNFLKKELSSGDESQTSSPISTESSNFHLSPTQRGVRTKRPRPTAFIAPTFSVSHKNEYVVPHVMKKKKKIIKQTILPLQEEANDNKDNNLTDENVRKCTHCEITKTPQWRAGPLGPKTLCNACGVRHKSGRLFPEYRPAASPTFVASLHSNSHRKVLEMRSKCDEN